MITLQPAAWRPRAEAHETRVRELTDAHLVRKSRGEKHPVADFMFDYYSFRPGKLRRWHPGFGVTLVDAPAYRDERFYTQLADGYTVDAVAFLEQRQATFERARELLTAVASRRPNYGCFGMHEWAMTKYATSPTRLGFDVDTSMPTDSLPPRPPLRTYFARRVQRRWSSISLAVCT